MPNPENLRKPYHAGAVLRVWLACLLASLVMPVSASVCVTDDRQRSVCLEQPARRIVALSPAATELLFAAGAGDRLVAAVSFSDYPPAAQALPRVGSNQRLDMEAILDLAPDLVVAWGSGNPDAQLQRLEAFGITVYYSEPLRFAQVATSLARLGKLAGTAEAGEQAAQGFRNKVTALRQQYSEQTPVSVFYQIWDQPLMTVNGDHLISQALTVCGGVNVFADLDSLAPRISREAVLEKDPRAIIAGGRGEEDQDWLAPWQAVAALQAVQRGNLFFVPPSLLQRPTPRMLKGTRQLCQHLEKARAEG